MDKLKKQLENARQVVISDYQTKVALIRKMKALQKNLDQEKHCPTCKSKFEARDKITKSVQTELQYSEIKEQIRRTMSLRRESFYNMR